jgi:hypothetical protein
MKKILEKIINYSMFLLRPILILASAEFVLRMVGFFMSLHLKEFGFINDVSFSSLNGVFRILYILIFNSFVLMFNSDDRIGQAMMLDRIKKRKNWSPFKFVLTTPFFYIEAALVLLLSIAFSFSFARANILGLFYIEIDMSSAPAMNALSKNIPFLIIIQFLAHVITAKHWIGDIEVIDDDLKKGRMSISFYTLKQFVIISVLYCMAEYLIVILLPAVASIVTAFGKKGLLLLALWIVIIFLAFFSIFALRAVLKRKFFIKKLKEYCRNNSLTLSEIVKPYNSILFDSEGFNFTVEKNGKKYDCKFISTIFPGSPLALSDSGAGLKLSNVRIISYKKNFTFTFEGENRKILLLVPTPKKVLVTIKNSELTEAEVGEKLGDYTLYTATTFLNNLERDCL